MLNESTGDTSFDGDMSDVGIESHGLTELGRIVDGLTRAVISARERATPLAQQLVPFRMKVNELKDQKDEKQQVSISNLI